MAKNRLYGVGEPLTMRIMAGEIELEPAVRLMQEVGITAMREWMHLDALLLDPVTPNQTAVEVYRQTLNALQKADIEVTGMNHNWFLPEVCHADDTRSVPKRDLADGSIYRQMLEMLEQSWFTMVSLFPQVGQWEVGNEWNIPMFLHPIGWKDGEKGFGLHEAMLYAADMMFFAARGIRRANPNAQVVSFSPTASHMIDSMWLTVPREFGISMALEELYEIIESGESFSKNSDDYFDMLSWHPYLHSQMGYAPVFDTYPAKEDWLLEEMPDGLWKAGCDWAYRIMVNHGDGYKKVLITEYGFSDQGKPEREKAQADLIRESFRLFRQMPYVKTVHFFRLFESENGSAFNINEIRFGIFREPHHDYAWRNKAKVLQEVYREP